MLVRSLNQIKGCYPSLRAFGGPSLYVTLLDVIHPSAADRTELTAVLETLISVRRFQRRSAVSSTSNSILGVVLRNQHPEGARLQGKDTYMDPVKAQVWIGIDIAKLTFET